MIRTLSLLLMLVALLGAGCRAGTAPQELEQLRARVSTLEAENAHLRGQTSLLESEREQLREQANRLATEVAKAEARGGAETAGVTAVSEILTVVPREVRPGEWIAVHVRNYPARLLPQAGVALRAAGDQNVAHVKQLAAANLFLLPVPQDAAPGSYQVVIGEAGPLGPGAKLDDRVSIRIRPRS